MDRRERKRGKKTKQQQQFGMQTEEIKVKTKIQIDKMFSISSICQSVCLFIQLEELNAEMGFPISKSDFYFLIQFH